MTLPANTGNNVEHKGVYWRVWWPATTMMLCSLLSYGDQQNRRLAHGSEYMSTFVWTTG